ncbi:GDP-mannose 4,6-dehydratase [Pelagibacteraceae bacterium]|nr:GDP-mannose 4,6-dehydratase [Pelagibacteraceae bacterium]
MKKKIFITGATGFIGSHLSELCVQKGFNVVAFDRYNPNNHWGWLEESKYKKDMNIILGDVRDYDSVLKSMRGCDVVFHLAALIGIPYSYISPLAYIRTNVEGTYNVLEASKNLNVEQVLVTSTSETYGSAKYVPIDEKHPLVGQSPYAASKIAADQLALSYHLSFDLPVKIVRPFNTYGPRQSLRAIIPTIITQALNKKNKIKLGNLSPTRDFLYVKDTCKAFLEIYKSRHLIGDTINVGNNTEISINQLAKKIIKIINFNTLVTNDKKRIRPVQSEVDRLCCNNKKILKKTKWKSSYNLNEGLKETIDWYIRFRNLYKSDIYHI